MARTVHNKIGFSIHRVEVASRIVALVSGDAVQSTDIADALGFEKRYLESLLQAMVHSDLLIGVRGPLGGYCLTEPAKQASVLDIVEALHGPQSNPLIRAWASLRPEDLADQGSLKLEAA